MYELASLLKLIRKHQLLLWFHLGPLFLTSKVTIIVYFLAKMAIFWLILYLLNCLLYEIVRPLILKLWGGWVFGGGELVIIFKYSVLRTGSCLELCGQLDEEMFTFFIIYYRTINQKDNMLYIELEKKHVFQFIYKDRNVKQL